MRKITKQLVLLAVVFIIYFGYSAWIDGIALYRIASVASGELAGAFKVGDFITDKAIIESMKDGVATIGSATVNVTGVMAQNSLLYALLSPWKLVLVGGVFALMIPLTKQLFFGLIIAIKDYIKNRRDNVLYNYQKAIAFAQGMKSKLETGDYEQIKAQYATLGTIKFQPKFLTTFMDDIGYALIREQDMNVYVKPAQVIIDSLTEMYESERKLAITGHPTEMFHDFKMGYDYVSIGSKYSIAYYKTIDSKGSSKKNRLGWKLFSLEMYKFYLSMILAIIPALIVVAIVVPIVESAVTESIIATRVGILTAFIIFMVFAVIINALMVFLKPQYRLMKKYLVGPAIIYYLLMILIGATFAVGLVAVIQVGNIVWPGTTSKTWAFLSSVANMVFATCLVLFVVSTLMDANVSVNGLTTKFIIDGIIIPLIGWGLVLAADIYGLFGTKDPSIRTTWTGVAFGIGAGFWLYLSISGVLLNNIVIPSKRRKKVVQKPARRTRRK